MEKGYQDEKEIYQQEEIDFAIKTLNNKYFGIDARVATCTFEYDNEDKEIGILDVQIRITLSPFLIQTNGAIAALISTLEKTNGEVVLPLSIQKRDKEVSIPMNFLNPLFSEELDAEKLRRKEQEEVETAKVTENIQTIRTDFRKDVFL